MTCRLCSSEFETNSYQITRLTYEFGEIIEFMDLCDACAQVIRESKDTLEFVER
jgi:hypothetical protein